MLRLCCHLLLIVSLLCNGIGAPWAMAHAHHGDAAHASAGHDPHAEHALHAQHTDHAMPDAADDDDGCCGKALCRCGCVLPAFVPLSIAFAVPQPLQIAPPQRAIAGVVAARTIPPFRPPA